MAAPPSFGPENVRRPVFRYAAGRAIVGAAASLSVRFPTAIRQATELRAEMPLAWVAVSRAARDQVRKARWRSCAEKRSQSTPHPDQKGTPFCYQARIPDGLGTCPECQIRVALIGIRGGRAKGEE